MLTREILPSEVVAAARSWKGARWQHQGRTRKGVDCGGLIIVVGWELGGLDLDFDKRGYGREPPGTGDNMLHVFRAVLDEVDWKDRQIGDIVLMRSSVARLPCHCGFLARRDGHETLIHSHSLGRSVQEDWMAQGDYLSRVVALFRFKGVVSDGI